MSEDRLERALQEMKEEDVDSGTLETARARVWEKMTNANRATCAEFRQDFRAYLSNELGGSRRILVEDHLSRCPGCRARIADMKGERTVVAMPRGLPRRRLGEGGPLPGGCSGEPWPRLPRCSSAVLYLGRDAIDGMMGPGGARATVVSADRGLYRLTSLSADLSAEARSAKVEARSAKVEGFSRSRRRHWRTGVGPHRSGSACGVAARRRIDRGCQRANRTVRDRRLERPGDSPPARRHHRQSCQTTPGPPAGSDS